uniref:Reverse transcriptase domain-containing protein n=1 Tax=Cyprinus carpio carpio TaxID=630221 RepID=A0A9J7YHT7_CYPCA
MCFQISTITTNTRRARYVPRRKACPTNLRPVPLTSTTTTLSIPVGLWNCQSAVNKADFISSIATHSGLNLMALTETWIKPEDTATPAALSTNFTCSHTPRMTGRGGGTSLLISKDWKFDLQPPPTGNGSFESHAVTVTQPVNIHFVVIYCPPGQLGNFLEELDMLLSNYPEDGTPLVLLADFNTLLASFDLKRVSTTATHKSGNQLDLIYTCCCSVDNSLVAPLHTSDHFLITANLALTPEAAHAPTQVTFRRNLRSLSPSCLSSVVSSSLPSLSQFSALDTNSATDTFCSTLTSCLDNFCPLSSRPARTTPSAPWLSDVLREHRSKLRAAERKWHKLRNSTDLSVYQSLLSSFSANVFTAKTSYYHDKINNCCDARTLFTTFSSLLNLPPPPPPSTLTADDFAVFFTNKTKTISDQFSTPQTEDNFTTTNAHSLSSFSPLSETDVSKLILSSHPTTCPLDPIPTHLLQAISSSVIPSLIHMINSSLHSGTFPSAFKQAQVSPLLKKPSLNPALLENYRPVSLLPFIAKTLERAVFNQLSMFLVQNNLLDSNQSGFKSGHSTETALLSVTEALRLARAASKSSVLILLDLSAAFDTVNHQILLSTLRKMGISGTALQWLISYLSDRSFMVSWRGEISKSQQLATGVPQGSVLGPLLFSIYMTSLGSVIQKHGFSYHCYADDTQLYFSFQSDDPMVVARISACLSDISSWMNDHHLQLNLTKTELLVVPANPSFHHNFFIQLGSSTITPSRTARNLGVVIDHQLSFTDHIATMTRSCRFALYNIRIRLDPSCQSKPPNFLSKLLFSPDWTTVMLSWRAFLHVLSSLYN